jgi:hypothetical protein
MIRSDTWRIITSVTNFTARWEIAVGQKVRNTVCQHGHRFLETKRSIAVCGPTTRPRPAISILVNLLPKPIFDRTDFAASSRTELSGFTGHKYNTADRAIVSNLFGGHRYIVGGGDLEGNV